MIFVRYPPDRESDSIQMWNPVTNGIVTTCNVIWMKQMYFECPEDKCSDIKPRPIGKEAETLVLLIPMIQFLMLIAMTRNN